MLKKMILLIVATSFLFILPVQSYSHNHSIQPQVQIGGS